MKMQIISMTLLIGLSTSAFASSSDVICFDAGKITKRGDTVTGKITVDRDLGKVYLNYTDGKETDSYSAMILRNYGNNGGQVFNALSFQMKNDDGWLDMKSLEITATEVRILWKNAGALEKNPIIACPK